MFLVEYLSPFSGQIIGTMCQSELGRDAVVAFATSLGAAYIVVTGPL